MQLKGKHILLGVTGGIAAYKTPFLVRDFVKMGAEVKVVMTAMAKQFVTPLTLATVSKNPIVVDFFDPESGQWNSHVSLGSWADAYVIAPATANTLAKMANGIADNLLLTTYLSARCPVFAAPAMDLDMMAHPATTQNIATLVSRGVNMIDANSGELASGLVGKGRMAEPAEICAAANTCLAVFSLPSSAAMSGLGFRSIEKPSCLFIFWFATSTGAKSATAAVIMAAWQLVNSLAAASYICLALSTLTTLMLALRGEILTGPETRQTVAPRSASSSAMA